MSERDILNMRWIYMVSSVQCLLVGHRTSHLEGQMEKLMRRDWMLFICKEFVISRACVSRKHKIFLFHNLNFVVLLHVGAHCVFRTHLSQVLKKKGVLEENRVKIDGNSITGVVCASLPALHLYQAWCCMSDCTVGWLFMNA